MLPHQQWVEREFDFGLAPSQFANILERLRGTPGRVEERTQGLERAVLTRRDGDRWSIQEHAGHLLDLEPLWYHRAEQIFAGEVELVAADMTNRTTHHADHNSRGLADLLRGFRAARSVLLTLLDRADEAVIVRSALHPRLQRPMRLVDLALFVAEHDDHHLATMTELRRRWGGP